MDLVYPANIINFEGEEMTAEDFSVLIGKLTSSYCGVIQGSIVAATNVDSITIPSGWASVGGVLVKIPSSVIGFNDYNWASTNYLNLIVDLSAQYAEDAAYLRIESIERSSIDRSGDVVSNQTFGISIAKITYDSNYAGVVSVVPLNNVIDNPTIFANQSSSMGVIERYGVPTVANHSAGEHFVINGRLVKANVAIPMGTVIESNSGSIDRTPTLSALYDDICYKPGDTLTVATLNCYGWITGGQDNMVLVCSLPKLINSRVSTFTLTKMSASDSAVSIKISVRVGNGYAVGGEKVIKAGSDNIKSIVVSPFISQDLYLTITADSGQGFMNATTNTKIANNTPVTGRVTLSGVFS